MARLNGYFLKEAESDEGICAEILLIEDNGDSYHLRCLCRQNGTIDLCEWGDGKVVNYLDERYGPEMVFLTARDTVLNRTQTQ